jgi:hypothetical protein
MLLKPLYEAHMMPSACFLPAAIPRCVYAHLICLQLSGATITVSDNVLEGGTREVLLAGSDAQCNTAKNLMEALMRSG